MNLLLDTHCLIWALTDAPELGQKARRAIASADSVWFSEASIWELGLKWRKGKIGLQPRRIVEQALRDRFRPLPIALEKGGRPPHSSGRGIPLHSAILNPQWTSGARTSAGRVVESDTVRLCAPKRKSDPCHAQSPGTPTQRENDVRA